MKPHAAAHAAMGEVTRPIISIMLVLCAVFVPVAFVSGLTGQFYRQFGITIAASTLISTFNSLTLSPALAALLLKPRDCAARLVSARHQPGARRIFRGSSIAAFEHASERYGRGVRRLTAIRVAGAGGVRLLLVCTWGMFQHRARRLHSRRRTSSI